MNHELHYVQHPWRGRLMWLITYVALMISILIGLYLLVGRARTYSLPTGSVELSTPYSKYLVGEIVSFTVKNNFNAPVQVDNGCPGEPLSVYRLENKRWVRIHDTTDKENCEGQSRNVTIPANRSLTATFALWPHLFDKPGTYRIAMQVEYYNAVPYQQFEVIKKPAITKPTNSTQNSSEDDTTTLPRSTQPTVTDDDVFENEADDD